MPIPEGERKKLKPKLVSKSKTKFKCMACEDTGTNSRGGSCICQIVNPSATRSVKS